MKIFLTTSHNQHNQVISLYKELRENYVDLYKFIIVESGVETFYDKKIKDNNDFILIKTNENSFWAESNSSGLKYIYSTFLEINFDLIIMNCDVKLNSWIKLSNINSPTTFYSVLGNKVGRSGYDIQNFLTAKHLFPYLQCDIGNSKSCYVDIVPTRFIYIPRNILKKIWGQTPNYSKLPHYSSDYEFTYRIKKIIHDKWQISNETFIEEDVSTTGDKVSYGKVVQRLSLLFKRRSVFNIKDRFWYALLITKDENLVIRLSYILSSIIKLFLQLLKPKK
jgi:hypothetical protein